MECARGYVADGHIPCAVVAVADSKNVLAKRCLNEVGREDPTLEDRVFALASITKAVVGVGVARLVEEGRLDYADPVAKHIPELGAVEWRRSITVGQIFTHSTGLRPVGLDEFVDLDPSANGIWDHIFDREPHYEPGTRMQYTTLTYQLLNEIVQRLLGTRMSSFLADYVYAPCGMVDTAFEPRLAGRVMPPIDHPMKTAERMRKFAQLEISGGGLWSTLRDLIQFAQAVLQSGRLMTPETYSFLTDPQPRLPMMSDQRQSCRTFGWNREEQEAFPHQPDSGFYHGGATGTVLWLDPTRDLIFVFLTNRWGSGNDHAFAALDCLYA